LKGFGNMRKTRINRFKDPTKKDEPVNEKSSAYHRR
jgi:hypothetical protein